MTAETVAHLHAAMKWDFQVLIVCNVILFVGLLVNIWAKR